MKVKKVKIPERKEKTTIYQVADFLAQTGFILEMEVSEILKKKSYKVTVNDYFFDYEENKKREIDIIALKIINKINVIFVIECKQSLSEDWVFVCSDRSPSRYYSYLKYSPTVSKIKETGLFDHLHTFNHKMPLAQNSTIRLKSGKRSESKDIYECIKKLPKIVVDKAYFSFDDKTERFLIFPLAVFSGQIFVAEYSNNLLVHEVDNVQYGTELDSNAYEYHFPYNMVTGAYGIYGNQNKTEEEKNTPVAETSRQLGAYYLIDFVTKKELTSFLNKIEKQVQKIDLKLWPVKN